MKFLGAFKLSYLGAFINFMILHVYSQTSLPTNGSNSINQVHSDENTFSGDLKKRQEALPQALGSFPALGGLDKQGRVFTANGQVAVQSNNYLRNSKARLNFVVSEPERAALTQKQGSGSKNSKQEQFKILQRSDENSRLSEENKKSYIAQSRGEAEELVQRNNFQNHHRRFKRKLGSNYSYQVPIKPNYELNPDSKARQLQGSQNLGSFPALGGFQGTVTADEANSRVSGNSVTPTEQASSLLAPPSKSPSGIVPTPELCKDFLASFNQKRLIDDFSAGSF